MGPELNEDLPIFENFFIPKNVYPVVFKVDMISSRGLLGCDAM
jgi:hypothetical protein